MLRLEIKYIIYLVMILRFNIMPSIYSSLTSIHTSVQISSNIQIANHITVWLMNQTLKIQAIIFADEN